MKRKYLFLNIALVAGLITVVFFGFYKPKEELVVITENGPIPVETINKIRELRKPVVHTGIDWASMGERLKGDPTTFTKEEEDAFNELHVLPLNWIVQQDCSEHQHEVLVHLRWQCESIFKYPPHPYQAIPLEELEELAWSDPLAALMMGMRLYEKPTPEQLKSEIGFQIGHDKQAIWFIRAAALSGKTGPLMRLAAEVRPNKSEPAYYGPEPVQRFAFLRIAQMLGDPRANDGPYRELIESSSPKDVAGYERAVETTFQYYMNMMAHFQKQTTGSTQVIELADQGAGQ